MKLGYTLVYVPDVAASLAFFDKAFGLGTRFVHDSGGYGELDTGATTLGFAQHAVARANLGRDYVAADTSDHPLGMEVGLVTDDVAAAYRQALAAGASPLAPPSVKPWGQTVAYVRCPDGTLVELCTAV
jgi:catechol 2,3-dioxygenase-like lactoylglutathione lyase family enzyme